MLPRPPGGWLPLGGSPNSLLFEQSHETVEVGKTPAVRGMVATVALLEIPPSRQVAKNTDPVTWGPQ